MTSTPRVSVFIVDDEPLARRRLRDLVREVPWLESVGEAATAQAAIAAINELHPDLVFLDVRLPGLSGLDVLAQVKHAPAVIFTTAHDQFAVTAFDVGALDYLLKPFDQERFDRAIDRARPLLERAEGTGAVDFARDAQGGERMTRLFVREGGRIVPIPLAVVERFQACDDYVVVHAGKRSYTISLTMNDVERRLDPLLFVRVHRSHIVNLDHVASMAPYDGSRFEIAMRNGTKILASRQRSRHLRELGR